METLKRAENSGNARNNYRRFYPRRSARSRAFPRFLLFEVGTMVFHHWDWSELRSLS